MSAFSKALDRSVPVSQDSVRSAMVRVREATRGLADHFKVEGVTDLAPDDAEQLRVLSRSMGGNLDRLPDRPMGAEAVHCIPYATAFNGLAAGAVNAILSRFGVQPPIPKVADNVAPSTHPADALGDIDQRALHIAENPQLFQAHPDGLKAQLGAIGREAYGIGHAEADQILSAALGASPCGLLATALEALPAYQGPHPSYERYNVAPTHYASAEEVRTRIDNADGVEDVRANSHSLGTYLGVEAQKQGVVSQQVLDVLSALRHGSDDPAVFAVQLTPVQQRAEDQKSEKNLGMNIPAARRHELAQLAPLLAPFRRLASFAEIRQDKTLVRAVAEFVKSSHNWGPQPEGFEGSAPIVSDLLSNGDFMKFADENALQAPMQRRPPVGVILRQLGWSEPISNNLQEASMGVQAIDRLLFLPRNATELNPLAKIASSPPPFPKDIADRIEPYAKDIQYAVKLNLALANGLQSGAVHLTDAEQRTFSENRLRLAYLSAGEMSGILAEEAKKSSPDRAARIQGTIGQLQLKMQAVERHLGADKVRDLDITGKSQSDIRAMMKPMMAQTRTLFEAAADQVANGTQKESILGWAATYANLTSLQS